MSNSNLEIRRGRCEDVSEIIQLIFSCYGDACSDTRMYQKEFLKKSMEDGSMELYLAKMDDHVIAMEVCGSREDFPGTGYLKNKMTHPLFRQRGVGRAVADAMMNHCDFSRWLSVFAYALTYNQKSQSLLDGYGYKMTGFSFNSFLKSQEQGGKEGTMPKRSHVIMVKNIAVKDVGTLYVNEGLRDIVSCIYEELSVNQRICTDCVKPTEKTKLQFWQDEFHQNVQIQVESPGYDLIEQIERIRKEYWENELQTCQLFLNIKEETAT